MTSPVITIDGPAASGKGTLARRLAETLGFYYLDSGAIYRLLALRILKKGLDPDNEKHATDEALAFAKEFKVTMINNPDIRNDTVAVATSKSSRFEGVRAALMQIQRDIASNPPKPSKGAVLEGRDIGTVICPNANLKVFLTASTAARAKRRTKELISRGIDVTYEAVLQDLEERDERDSTRAVAPLKPAEDAVTVDTSGMDAEAALALVLGLARKSLPNEA